jgi:uncharacterized protein (TIGR02453 family)
MLQLSTVGFLKNLAKNNDKSWFDAHRKQYDAARADYCQFVEQLITKISQFDTDVEQLQAKNCLFRVNRDVRFSKDKSPYKTNFGASISKGGKKSGYAGYYFHLEPGKSFFGGGIWMPEADRVKKIRQEIDYCFDEFKGILKQKPFQTIYKDLYTGEDSKLSRIPQGFEKDNPAGEYLKLKSWLATMEIPDSQLLSKTLLSETVKAAKALRPLNRFLNRAIEE